MNKRLTNDLRSSDQTIPFQDEKQQGTELIDQADETEQQFFQMMNKYNLMKIKLQSKYKKAKELLEQSNQKMTKYKLKLEAKNKENKILREEIAVLRLKDTLSPQEFRKFEGTEIVSMRKFHEKQLKQLRSSLGGLEASYHKKLDKVKVNYELKFRQMKKEMLKQL